MQKAIQILYGEHRSISAVLSGLLELARAAQDPSIRPEFRVFHAMIRYIDAFPERLHHPKEDQFLFTLLNQRSPESRALVEELRVEHVKGAKLVRDLEAALLVFEVNWPRGAAAFTAAVEAYSRFHWDHMRKEEKQLLPLAERDLTAEDWQKIDDAFAGNMDPIADLREKNFNELYQHIVNIAPDPVGLGDRWKKTS